MFTLISFILSLAYILLMTFLVNSTWYFIILWVITGIIIFYILSISSILFLIEVILPRLSEKSKIKYKYLHEMGWWINTFLLNVHVKYIGKENIPKEGKLTLYGNHKSKLDPLYLTPGVTRAHGYAAKSELIRIPFVSTLLKVMNSFYVYRDDNRASLKELLVGIEKAKEGHIFAMYPEGGTMYRDHEDVREVRVGAFKLAQKAETDIMPFTMLNTNKWATRKFYLKPIKVKVIFHPVIKYEDYKDLSTNEIADKVIEVINSGVK